jgi:hypothetical protein
VSEHGLSREDLEHGDTKPREECEARRPRPRCHLASRFVAFVLTPQALRDPSRLRVPNPLPERPQ